MLRTRRPRRGRVAAGLALAFSCLLEVLITALIYNFAPSFLRRRAAARGVARALSPDALSRRGKLTTRCQPLVTRQTTTARRSMRCWL